MTGVIIVPGRWWSAGDRIIGPLLGALITLNIIDFNADLGGSLFGAMVSAVFGVVCVALLVVWYQHGRELDRLARASWVLTERTYGLVRTEDAIVTLRRGVGNPEPTVDVHVEFPTSSR
jgi:hypothetical protein